MDAFSLLKKDHDEVKKLFKEYEAKGDKAYKSKLEVAQTIYTELSIHETIEEEVFYPAIKEHATKKGVEIVLEGYQEHHIADLLIGELKDLDIEDQTYDAKFKVLQENIEHHIEEEEREMFPLAEKAVGDQAVELGEAMAARKEELMKEGVPAR